MTLSTQFTKFRIDATDEAYDYINAAGVRHVSERQVEITTAVRKIRPARNAFGDWGAYDSEGMATVVTPAGATDENSSDLVADYVTTGWEQFMDHSNDVYVSDVLTSRSDSVSDSKDFGLSGWTVIPYAGHAVECWYCKQVAVYRDFVTQSDLIADKERYVVELLKHQQEHRAEGDQPFVTTVFQRTITRPSGDTITTPAIVRTWQLHD